MKRSSRLLTAKETVQITERGSYTASGKTIDISRAVRHCLDATRLFSAADLQRMRDELLSRPGPNYRTSVEVANESTLEGIFHLLAERPDLVAVLNFASAKNPGGGFLNGSQAQEESLARSSALYASLMRAWDFYEQHRASPSLLYSDAMILSPGCPVFRTDDGDLLDEPHEVAFITSPAPNAGAAANTRRDELPAVPETIRRRSELILALAASQGYHRLVLGAWGCGVFRNDPAVVAAAFAAHLAGNWAGRFEQVRFSVLDRAESPDTFKAFRNLLLFDMRDA